MTIDQVKAMFDQAMQAEDAHALDALAEECAAVKDPLFQMELAEWLAQ
jgi:hypothetical protein